MHDLTLSGCTPEPLLSYLKALGVLRLLGEQKEPNARGAWKADTFHLGTTLEKEDLVSFFLDEYTPTPIVAPWAGGSGFFKKDNKKFLEALSASHQVRCKPYAEVIEAVSRVLQNEKITDKPTEELKARLLQRYRCELPEIVVEWMDAAMVLQSDSQSFAPVLGTGGNDGRLDFTQNFMGRLINLGIANGKPHQHSALWLQSALFGQLANGLQEAAVGQFSPGRAGGANATQGMEGRATDNPWDFVLMLEGSLALAGAAVRRLGVDDDPRASFPFTVRPAVAGYGSAADKDTTDSRGEIWLPIWIQPATISELRALLSEGRATVSRRRARTGIDFARAAATLGVDRGIYSFRRYAFLKRSGKAYLASPLGNFG